MNDVHLQLLDRIEIASPCSARWEDMVGDDRKRLCADCDLHVYNIAAMTRTEAEALIEQTQGRLCAQIYRRSDGTVMTRDCPVGLAALREKAVRTSVRAVMAVLFVLVTCISTVVAHTRFGRSTTLAEREPFQTLRAKLNPTPLALPPMGGAIRGRIAMPRTGFVVTPPPVDCESTEE